MAFGGVDIGSAIANEAQSATLTTSVVTPPIPASWSFMPSPTVMSIGTSKADDAELLINVDSVQQSRPAPTSTINYKNVSNGMLSTIAFANPDCFIPVPRAKPPATIQSTAQSICFMSSESTMPRAVNAPTGKSATT